MAYDVTYYRNRQMTEIDPGGRTLTDAQLRQSYAPTSENRVVYARHSNDTRMDLYGYDGKWRKSPPQAARKAGWKMRWWRVPA